MPSNNLWRLHLLPAAILLAAFCCAGCLQNSQSGGIAHLTGFAPNAVRIEVQPLRASHPVGTQHLVIATVLDGAGEPRRNRRIEWMLEGVGHLVEVDESSSFAGRGQKIDNRYAVTHTNTLEKKITRGNDDPTDDFVIRPGQSWCILSSPEEGVSRLTVFAPDIRDWDKRKIDVEVHWANAQWHFPPPATVRAGAQHTLTTSIVRHTDRSALPNYRVRYSIQDGPPAMLSNQSREVIAISDQNGNAIATLSQLQLQPGVNRINVEVLRPADPFQPNTPPVVLAKQETTVDWQAPQLAIQVDAPRDVTVNEEASAVITVTNAGKVDAQRGMVRVAVPEGMSFVRSDPQPDRERDGYLYYSLMPLGAGRQQFINATFRAGASGSFTTTAQAVTTDGLHADNTVSFRVDTAQLKILIDGPTNGSVGQRVPLRVTVTNPSSGTANNVRLEVVAGDGLEFETRNKTFDRVVNQTLTTLGPGETQSFPLPAVARGSGKLTAKASARTATGLSDQADWSATFEQSQLSVRRLGPSSVAVGRDAEWELRVRNSGAVELNNVVLRERLPSELVLRAASSGGRFDSRYGEITWHLGRMLPNEEMSVRYTAAGARLTTRGQVKAIVTAMPYAEQQIEGTVEVLGVPALKVEVTSDYNPVEVGRRIMYTVRVINQGTLPLDQVGVIADIPAQLRALDAIGPRRGVIDGSVVTFPVIESVGPGQMVTLMIPAQAIREGDARFRAAVKTLSMPTPIITEEATRVIPPMRGPQLP